jgi:hypothetical protein
MHLLYFQIFSTGFLNIIFILRDIQVLKEGCYNINICDHLTQELGTAAAPTTTAVVSARRPKAEPSHPPLEPPHPHIYKRKEGMINENIS